MSYKAKQLPFREYQEIVKKWKKIQDHSAVHYPLFFEVRDASGKLIISQQFDNPFQRSEPEVMTEADWDSPVTITLEDGGRIKQSNVIEEVTVEPLAEEIYEQLSFEEEEQ